MSYPSQSGPTHSAERAIESTATHPEPPLAGEDGMFFRLDHHAQSSLFFHLSLSRCHEDQQAPTYRALYSSVVNRQANA